MKNIKKSLRSVFCALLAAAALAASLPAHAVSQAEIDDLQKKLDALEQQAQEQQDVINDLTSQKARFITRKLALDNKIEINRQMIELIGEQIEIYDEIIAEKQAELDKALEKETAQTELLRSRIRAMEENSTYSYASFIFDSSSVTELLSRIGDVNDIMHYDKTLEEEYMAAREDVESIKKSYEEARHEQELLQKELDTKQAELDAQVEAAYTMIADIDTLSDDAQAEYDAIAEEETRIITAIMAAAETPAAAAAIPAEAEAPAAVRRRAFPIFSGRCRAARSLPPASATALRRRPARAHTTAVWISARAWARPLWRPARATLFTPARTAATATAS